MGRKTIIAGGRMFCPTKNHKLWLTALLKKLDTEIIVSGGAMGADQFGENMAEHLGLVCKVFPADWQRYGKSAGYKRNLQMAYYADSCIIFPGGRGTDHMKLTAENSGLHVIVWGE